MSYLEKKYHSSFVRISSHDRVSGSSSHFSISTRSNETSLREVRAVQVLSALIPNTFYNIPKYWNRFEYSHTTSPATGPYTESVLFIDPGSYTIQDLCTALATQMTADLGSTVQITFDSNGVVTIAGSGIYIRLTSGHERKVNPVAYYLGFQKTTGYSPTHVADSLPALGNPDTVYIHCPSLSVSSVYDFSDAAPDCILAVPNTAEYGDVMHYQSSDVLSNLMEFAAPRYMSEMTFTLRDKWNEILDTNGADWTITMKIFYSLL